MSTGNIVPRRVAFVSTRIAGTDGVSLEIEKWARVIEGMGHECFYVAGELDRPADHSFLIEEAHFNHPRVRAIADEAFGTEVRSAALSREIMSLSLELRDRLYQAIDNYQCHAIIAENALTIPMNIPLGIALVHVIQERGLPCIAHHHDFYWERDRFLINSVDDYLSYAFPPCLAQIQHVVINSLAAEEFSRRTGLSCRIVPNVMDFENPPPAPDGYGREFRRAIGLAENDLLILQPTRIVARKGIEHSIELVRRLERGDGKLVITHASGDEGDVYSQRIRNYADLMGVELIFADKWIADKRGTSPDGRKLFTIDDVYPEADLVTYPSEYEGFGNAFLEAIYYKRPVVCNRYAIYRTDIEPCGFRPVLFDRFLTEDTIADVRRVLDDPQFTRDMVDHNYQVAREFFSYRVVQEELQMIVRRPQNIYRLLGRDIRLSNGP